MNTREEEDNTEQAFLDILEARAEVKVEAKKPSAAPQKIQVAEKEPTQPQDAEQAFLNALEAPRNTEISQLIPVVPKQPLPDVDFEKAKQTIRVDLTSEALNTWISAQCKNFQQQLSNIENISNAKIKQHYTDLIESKKKDSWFKALSEEDQAYAMENFLYELGIVKDSWLKKCEDNYMNGVLEIVKSTEIRQPEPSVNTEIQVLKKNGSANAREKNLAALKNYLDEIQIHFESHQKILESKIKQHAANLPDKDKSAIDEYMKNPLNRKMDNDMPSCVKIDLEKYHCIRSNLSKLTAEENPTQKAVYLLDNFEQTQKIINRDNDDAGIILTNCLYNIYNAIVNLLNFFNFNLSLLKPLKSPEEEGKQISKNIRSLLFGKTLEKLKASEPLIALRYY